MFTNSEIIRKKIEMSGKSIYDIYLASGQNRNVYTSFEKNRFTKSFLDFVGEQIGEDLSMYVNAK